MKGVIHLINKQMGLAAIQTENKDFSVIEFLDENPSEEGDEVYWDCNTPLGSTIIVNLTKRQKNEVYFQNHWISQNQLKNQLRLK